MKNNQNETAQVFLELASNYGRILSAMKSGGLITDFSISMCVFDWNSDHTSDRLEVSINEFNFLKDNPEMCLKFDKERPYNEESVKEFDEKLFKIVEEKRKSTEAQLTAIQEENEKLLSVINMFK